MLSNPLHRAIIDGALAVAVLSLSMVVAAQVFLDLPRPVFETAVGALALVAVGSVVARVVTRPDHLKARQSHAILEIADASLAHLRRGLDRESADAVCRLALRESEAAAVAITDTKMVLGFAGLGEDHHRPGRPIITRATREAVTEGRVAILASKEEIGCPEPGCLLRAAIVVPLEMRGRPCGTLKFYYSTPRLLNETQVTMVEGLAKLLSTQLELSELDRQTELAHQMELKALQSQINPHFLFNTINTVAMLIRTDAARARHLLREFARFYRRMLENAEDLVALGRELEYVRTYVHLEQGRFGDRLRYEEDVPDALRELRVPSFILQPLAENSVKHGMDSDGPMTVRVVAERTTSGAIITVTDDGVGIPEARLPHVLEPGFGSGLGIALNNVQERLRGHFGHDSGLTVENAPEGGTRVTVRIALGERSNEVRHGPQSARM